MMMIVIMRRMQQHCSASTACPMPVFSFSSSWDIIRPQSNHDDGYEYQRDATTLLCRLRPALCRSDVCCVMASYITHCGARLSICDLFRIVDDDDENR